jgi:hypothetical protein
MGKVALIDVPGVGKVSVGIRNTPSCTSGCPELDLILWVVKADDRALAIDQQVFNSVIRPTWQIGTSRSVCDQPSRQSCPMLGMGPRTASAEQHQLWGGEFNCTEKTGGTTWDDVGKGAPGKHLSSQTALRHTPLKICKKNRQSGQTAGFAVFHSMLKENHTNSYVSPTYICRPNQTTRPTTAKSPSGLLGSTSKGI